MRTALLLTTLILSLTCSALDHLKWDGLLKKYVSEKGVVDYSGFTQADRAVLDGYLDEMRNNIPTVEWRTKEKLAYWINVYNAVTVKLILDNYPVKSIQDLHPFLKVPGVNTVWHKTYFFPEEEKYSLDEIEHGILRKKFEEPRIHFAINCASKSCPMLRNEAYTADKLDSQLEEQAKSFINTEFYNRIAQSEVEISKIFNWFKSDFTKSGTVIEYLNKYSEVKIDKDASVDYLEYNWKLNE